MSEGRPSLPGGRRRRGGGAGSALETIGVALSGCVDKKDNRIRLMLTNQNQMQFKQIGFFANIYIALVALTTGAAYANELRLPNRISCANGSVTIEQTSPATTYEQTKTAAFTLIVNGFAEAATGLQNGNVTKITSKNYYVSRGTGGLTFARHKGKPYFGNDGNAELICTDSKYGEGSPGFSASYE